MDFGGPSRRDFRQLGEPVTLQEGEAGPAIYRPRVRKRSIADLTRALLGLLRGNYVELVLITIAVSAATSLRLTYLASPKFAIDYVLMDKPGPKGIPRWLGLPHDRPKLLLILGAVVLLSETLALCVDVWGRYRFRLLTWHVQIRFSRRVLRSALGLPLWKLQGVKSGGITSLIREDARAPADILFVIVVTLWRSVLQLGGSLVVLAMVDAWLLLSALALIPVVWISHRGLVSTVQPMYRRSRRGREEVDARIAEAVSGIRTIRALLRERSVVHRFVADTHLMVRHMMRAWWRATNVESAWRIRHHRRERFGAALRRYPRPQRKPDPRGPSLVSGLRRDAARSFAADRLRRAPLTRRFCRLQPGPRCRGGRTRNQTQFSRKGFG